jgi:hypothetical protein
MWSPAIAHLFHLKRADMADHTLHELVAMHEAAKERQG